MYFGGNILYQEAYRKYVKDNFTDYNDIKERFPDADYVTRNTFFLGISQIITEQQSLYVCRKIEEFMEKYTYATRKN